MENSQNSRWMIAMYHPRWPVVVFVLLLSSLALYIAIHPNPRPFAGLNQTQFLHIAGDHWFHFGFFLLLGVSVCWMSIPSIRWWWAIIPVMIATVGSEWVQSWFPWKIFDWWDVVANIVGCLVGFTITALIQRIYSNPGKVTTSDDCERILLRDIQ